MIAQKTLSRVRLLLRISKTNYRFSLSPPCHRDIATFPAALIKYLLLKPSYNL